MRRSWNTYCEIPARNKFTRTVEGAIEGVGGKNKERKEDCTMARGELHRSRSSTSSYGSLSRKNIHAIPLARIFLLFFFFFTPTSSYPSSSLDVSWRHFSVHLLSLLLLPSFFVVLFLLHFAISLSSPCALILSRYPDKTYHSFKLLSSLLRGLVFVYFSR